MALKTQEETQAKFKQLRTQMKPVNFGKIYGMSHKTLWRRFLAQGRNISLEETKLIDTVWNETFPKTQNYQKKCKTLYDSSIAPLNVLGGTHYITSLWSAQRYYTSQQKKFFSRKIFSKSVRKNSKKNI